MNQFPLKEPITLRALKAYKKAGLADANNNNYVEKELELLTGPRKTIVELFNELFDGDYSGTDFESIPFADLRRALLFFGENSLGYMRGLNSSMKTSSPSKQDSGASSEDQSQTNTR